MKQRDGQAMLLAVLSLGGAILGATTIAGLLLLYQIRATTDSQNSAKAIFAADSGVEWSLFDIFCNTTTTADPNSRCVQPPREQSLPGNPPGTLGDGAVVSVLCYTSSTVPVVVACSDPTAVSAISKGLSLDSKRAFFLDLSTGTLP